MLQFVRSQTPVLARNDGAEIRGRKLDLDVFGAILRQERNAIAAADSFAAQRGRRTRSSSASYERRRLPCSIAVAFGSRFACAAKNS
jgi:hypothetical protein